MFGLEPSAVGILLAVLMGVGSFWLGRRLSRGWREKRAEKEQAARRASETRQQRRARERRQRPR